MKKMNRHSMLGATYLKTSHQWPTTPFSPPNPLDKPNSHAVRHAIPAGVNEKVIANGMPKVGTDFAVPDAALSTMMQAYASVRYLMFCLATSATNHLHLNLLPRNQQELQRAKGNLSTIGNVGRFSRGNGIG